MSSSSRHTIRGLTGIEVSAWVSLGKHECALEVADVSVYVPPQHSPEQLIRDADTFRTIGERAAYLARQCSAWAEQGIAARGGAA